MQTLGQGRSNFLRAGANFDAMDVPVLAQAVVDEIDDAGGNGEAQTFAASALRENESVDAQAPCRSYRPAGLRCCRD